MIATGCLSNARMPDIKGLDRLQGQGLPHRPLAARGGRFHRPARRRDRHRLVGDPVDARSSPSRRASSRCSSAPPNFSIPARNAPLTDGGAADVFATNYPEIRRFAREEARNGIYTEMPDRGALDDGDNERRAKYEARWEPRRPHLHVGLQQPRARQGGQRHRRRFRPREDRARSSRTRRPRSCCSRTTIRSAPSASASTPTISRPSTAPNVTLVDIKSDPIEEITDECRAHRRQGLRGRRAGAGDRLRRHDGLGREDRHSRPRRRRR